VMIFVIEEELGESCNCSWEVLTNVYWRNLVSFFLDMVILMVELVLLTGCL
jgi:hypothetical protein